MVEYEDLLDHIGFYDVSPTFNQLRQCVRLKAYFLWEESKVEREPEYFWVEAERLLFKGLIDKGYAVGYCDRSLLENQGFYRHWPLQHVSPQGVRDFEIKEFKKLT